MEELFKSMEKRISNLKKLSELMIQMKDISLLLKNDIHKLDDFKNLIKVNELDESSFSLIKNLQEIDKTQAIEIGKADLKLSDYDFLNWENVRKGLSERGVKVIKDEQVKNFFNNSMVVAMQYFTSKEQARDKAKKLVKKSRKRIKKRKR